MNGLPYYKAYPRDFIEGTIGMDFETKAAYRLVLDLIYMQGGNLPDDARYISGLLGCSVKKWNTIRQKLIDAGKIEARGSCLGNYRADKELETLGKVQDRQRENRSRPNKIKEIKTPRFDQSEPEPDTDIDDDEDARAITPDPSEGLMAQACRAAGREFGSLNGRGTRFGMSPSEVEALRRWQADLGLTPVQIIGSIQHQASRMRGPPNSLTYFTQGLQQLAGELAAPPLEINPAAGGIRHDRATASDRRETAASDRLRREIDVAARMRRPSSADMP